MKIKFILLLFITCSLQLSAQNPTTRGPVSKSEVDRDIKLVDSLRQKLKAAEMLNEEYKKQIIDLSKKLRMAKAGNSPTKGLEKQMSEKLAEGYKIQQTTNIYLSVLIDTQKDLAGRTSDDPRFDQLQKSLEETKVGYERDLNDLKTALNNEENTLRENGMGSVISAATNPAVQPSPWSVHVITEAGALCNKKWRYLSGRITLGFVPEKKPQLFLGACLGADNYDAFYTIPFSFSVKYYFSNPEEGFNVKDEWGISCMADIGIPLLVHEKVEYFDNFKGGHAFYDFGVSIHFPFLKQNFLFTVYFKQQSIDELSLTNEYPATNYSSFNFNIGILF